MIKGFRQITSLTALSRVFGLIRDVAFSHFFGAGRIMDAWIIAFQIPNLSRRLFGEGAASASLIPVYRQQLDSDRQEAAKLANTVVTAVFTLLAALVVIGVAGLCLYRAFCTQNPDTKMMLSLIALMLPYMIMICTVAILAGILNVHRHFAVPAAAPIVLNIFIISAILITGWVFKISPVKQVFFVAGSVLVAGVVQLAIQIPPLRASGVIIKPAWDIRSEAFRKVIFLMAPMIIGLTATQLNTLADTWIAKFFSGSPEKDELLTIFGYTVKYPLWDGAVSYLYYSQRLYQFPLGVLGISLATAIFPVMSAEAAKQDFHALRKTIAKGVKGAAFVAIPATAGLMLVARPVVSAVFEHGKFSSADSTATAQTLIFYAIGLTGFFCQQIVTRAFFSMQDSKMPAITAGLAVIVNIFLNLTLIWKMGTAGLALSTALCSYLQVTILVLVLRRRFSHKVLEGLTTTLIKTATATAIMFTTGWIILHQLHSLPAATVWQITKLAIVVPAAIASYFLAAKVLKIESLSLLVKPKTDNQPG